MIQRILSLIFILGYCVQILSAQQIEQYTQYMLNDFIINPAAAGSNNHGEAKLLYRRQWLGAFDGAEPTTIIASVHTDIDRFPNVGVGATVFSDVTGPSRRVGAQLAYAYKITLDAGGTLALGLGAKLVQQSLDWTSLVTTDPDDPAIVGNNESQFGTDFNAGIFIYDKEYYVGLTAAQLLETQYEFNPDDGTGLINNARHFYVMAGYKYEVSDVVELEPSVLVKYLPSVPIQFDLNARLIYDKKYWAGFNYRTYDAIGILAGLTFNDDYHLGYAYDLTTSELSTVSGGTHEIMLGVDFGKDKSIDPAPAY